MAVFPVEDDICEKKASDFLWETLYFQNKEVLKFDLVYLRVRKKSDSACNG